MDVPGSHGARAIRPCAGEQQVQFPVAVIIRLAVDVGLVGPVVPAVCDGQHVCHLDVAGIEVVIVVLREGCSAVSGQRVRHSVAVGVRIRACVLWESIGCVVGAVAIGIVIECVAYAVAVHVGRSVGSVLRVA